MAGLALAALLAFSFLLPGATTTTWEMNGYQDFLRGRMEGLSLTRDGRLVLGPKLDTLFQSDQAEIWSVARASDGSLYLGTGNRGRLYKLDAAGNSTLVWTADQPEIFAVAVDSKGVVYAGTSPDGKVYRIESGKATEYFAPEARYIWALAIAPDGALFVATGDQGKIFRVVPNGSGGGRGELYYDTGQGNVTSLALDAQGRLLAGSEPNGLLYRITAAQRAFVLYRSSLAEIRGIIAATDGSVYAAALGGGVARRTGAASSSTSSTGAGAGLPTVTTSITVTDQADQQAGVTPPKPEASKPPAPQVPAASTSTSTVEYAGAERSAVYKISADNTVETLWSSKDENVYDLAVSGASVLFITDVQGRIYRLDADRKAALVAQAGQGDATRLLESPGGFLAATGNLAMVLRLGTTTGPGGWFESPVHDAGTVARWGRITWRDAAARGMSIRTRSGNSARPDSTWSDWSEPITASGSTPLSSPNARYIQWRAEFSGAGGAAPALESVTVAFLPQNTPPVVRSISVTPVPGAGKATAAASSTASAYSVTVTDTGEAPAAAGTSAQTISRAMNQQLQILWQADDPDGDRLLYSLYFRGEDESQWKVLRANVSENTFALDGDQLADGRYYFRVTASDRPSNPAELAREAELVSPPVLIDNTPPVVTANVARAGATVEITVDAEDRVSALRRCEYSVDAGPWLPVEAADGVTDSPRERFVIRLGAFPAGEHVVAIRVVDIAGNAGLAKVVVR